MDFPLLAKRAGSDKSIGARIRFSNGRVSFASTHRSRVAPFRAMLMTKKPPEGGLSAALIGLEIRLLGAARRSSADTP
jgi:hypothetical protein